MKFSPRLRLSEDAPCLHEGFVSRIKKSLPTVTVLVSSIGFRRMWELEADDIWSHGVSLPAQMFADCSTGQLYDRETGQCLSSSKFRVMEVTI